MKLQALTLTDFRNIRAAAFAPSAELTVLCGKNGQGKTNLLESIFLLTGSKSFRGAKDVQLVREGAEYAVVEGVVAPQRPGSVAAPDAPQAQTAAAAADSAAAAPGAGADAGGNAQDAAETSSAAAEDADGKHIRIFIAGENSEKRGRSARVNGVDYGRATQLAGLFTAVVFEPDHLRLIKGSPEGRRRFLDAALCQLYPQYLVLLRRYGRVLEQKNALLKEYARTRDADGLLDVFDESLAAAGEEITARRAAYLSVLAPLARQNYADLASGSEQMEMTFVPSFTENLLSVLHAARRRDIAAGFCTSGPHRDDIAVTVNGRDARQFGSQGQQRSAVLSIKLAEAAAAYAVTDTQPVLLLDDVLSELDETRQAYLLNRMKDRQTIVTACDPALFERTNGRIYTMENGVLSAR